MAKNQNRIDQLLLAAQVMTENALADEVIKTALAGFGYSEEKLNAGKKLYEEAVALQNAQKKEYGDQVAATAELNDVWDQARQQYIRTLKIARIAFNKNIKADKATMLFGRRKESLSGWLAQAQIFYANILKDTHIDFIGKRRVFYIVSSIINAIITSKKGTFLKSTFLLDELPLTVIFPSTSLLFQ